MEDQRCIWERMDDGCHWCGLTNGALVCGHCRQFKTLEQDRKEMQNVTRPGIW